MARRSDGSVVAWGDNYYGQCNVPALPVGLTYVEVAAGGTHTVARRSDGSVVAWGSNDYGQCNVPALPVGLTYVEVAAGTDHTVARRSDGSVVAWGDNSYGQCNVPALPAGLTYVEVAAGGWSHGGASERRLRRRVGGQRLRPVQRSGASGRAHLRRGRGGRRFHTVARRSDGSVVAWGSNTYGQCNVPPLPSGLTYVEIAAGDGHTVARRSDGSVVAWGDNYYGQCNVPALPAGLTYVEVAAGGDSHGGAVRCRRCGRVCRHGLRWCGHASLRLQRAAHRANVFLTLTSGSPNAAGFLYGGGVPVAPYPLGSGCEVQVDLPSAIPFFPVMTNSTGAWSMGLLIPPDPNLVGVQAALQVALFSTSGPLGFDLSNGLIVTVGY